MVGILAWIIAVPLLGFLTGLRTMTPMAVLCWFAWAGHLEADHTWAFWASRPITVAIFTVLALGELVGDKLPNTPARISPFPLAARIGFGGLVGALAATALHGSWIEGALLGCLGAVCGSYAGYFVRRWLTRELGMKDLYVALVEDALTIGLSVVAMGFITA